MSAATLVNVAAAGSPRLLVDLEELDGHDFGDRDRESGLERLEAVLGREFADRLVAALSTQARCRLDAALTPEFAEHIASALEKRPGEAV